MTSHDTAPEVAAKALSGHIGGVCCHKTGGVGSSDCECRDIAAEVLSAYISTLSPDVSGLVERLKTLMEGVSPGPWVKTTFVDNRRLGSDHHSYKVSPQRGVYGSVFEPDADFIIAAHNDLPALLDALTALSLQLAAMERERDELASFSEDIVSRFKKQVHKIGPALIDRAETAEASLTLAQEENERLRAAIIKAVDPSSAGIGGIESAEDGVAYMAGVLLPALGIGDTPSKEDKTDG